jgi:16S rRNA G966 N2-methylase RsmD
MKQWYASVTFGLEGLCAKILNHHGARDIKQIDGALLFSNEKELNSKCLNNLFYIILKYNSDSISDAAKQLIKKRYHLPKLSGYTFRLIFMDNGKLCAVPPNIVYDLERIISYKTQLTPNRANPDTEIWLNRRNDGSVFFKIRMKKHAAFNKTLNKGELRPDIVNIMLHEAKINKDSIIVDLFGGWGAIAAAVTEGGDYHKIYSGDSKNECVLFQKNRLKKNKNCFINQWDARNIPLEDNSVDAVITDPPWGEYEETDIPALYETFIKETARILRPGGMFVFITSAENEAQTALDKYGFGYTYIPFKINGKNTHLFTAECLANPDGVLSDEA